jgi:hypothetical protein
VILQTTVRMCFGPFCRNVRRVERVEEAAGGLAAVSDPQRSDVTVCETNTTLEVVTAGTRVSYRTRIVPAFWIPPLVGRRWMLNTLQEASIDLFRHVELRAQEGVELAASHRGEAKTPKALENDVESADHETINDTAVESLP